MTSFNEIFGEAVTDACREFAVESGQLWTPEMVERRLLEAVQTYEAMPDKEIGWMNSLRSHMPETVKDPQDFFERGYATTTPARIGLTSRQITEAEQALDFLSILQPNEKLVIKEGLVFLQKGCTTPQFNKIKQRLGWGKISDATVRRHYKRGMIRICEHLNRCG